MATQSDRMAVMVEDIRLNVVAYWISRVPRAFHRCQGDVNEASAASMATMRKIYRPPQTVRAARKGQSDFGFRVSDFIAAVLASGSRWIRTARATPATGWRRAVAAPDTCT